MHPDARMLWGAQLDPKRRLAQAMPQLAAQLSRGAGWYRVDEGLYVFRRIDPLGDTARDGFVDNPPVFDLVSFTRAAALPPALPIDLWLPLVVVLAIAALGSALLVTSRLRVARAEQQSRALLEENSRANELRSWIKEHLYQLSLKMHGARDPEGFGALVLADLAQPLRLAAACFYAMQEGRAQPIAGYGLPERFELREFAPGEGLVGESIRTRSEKRLRPPPPGYLDASAGLGDGAAADLRILPLWVHGRTVGVLELAFVQLLDAREEEFLRQVLPLLALNLDSLLERHPVAA
jgi:hypothetical protein